MQSPCAHLLVTLHKVTVMLQSKCMWQEVADKQASGGGSCRIEHQLSPGFGFKKPKKASTGFLMHVFPVL